MREIIQIHIGQAGIQIGNAIQHLINLEHDIQPNGTTSDSTINSPNHPLYSFFSETQSGNLQSRSIFVDLDPQPIDVLRQGDLQSIWNSENLIFGQVGTGGNFAKGCNGLGNQVCDQVLDRVRRVAEGCEDLQGFMIYSSVGGGTGSGLGSLLLSKLQADFSGKIKHMYPIYPDLQNPFYVIEPYNALLATNSLLEHADAVFPFENKAIFDIYQRSTAKEHPTYQDLNHIISQVVSSITCSMRFDGALNNNLNEIQMNLVADSQLKFLIQSLAPLDSIQNAIQRPSGNLLTERVFDKESSMVKADVKLGKFLSCNLIYRGDFVPKDISCSFAELKCRREIQFVENSPLGYRVGINYQEPVVMFDSDLAKTSRQLLMICCNTAISELFSNICSNFDAPFSECNYIHQYLQNGIEEFQFNEARERLLSFCLNQFHNHLIQKIFIRLPKIYDLAVIQQKC